MRTASEITLSSLEPEADYRVKAIELCPLLQFSQLSLHQLDIAKAEEQRGELKRPSARAAGGFDRLHGCPASSAACRSKK